MKTRLKPPCLGLKSDPHSPNQTLHPMTLIRPPNGCLKENFILEIQIPSDADSEPQPQSRGERLERETQPENETFELGEPASRTHCQSDSSAEPERVCLARRDIQVMIPRMEFEGPGSQGPGEALASQVRGGSYSGSIAES